MITASRRAVHVGTAEAEGARGLSALA